MELVARGVAIHPVPKIALPPLGVFFPTAIATFMRHADHAARHGPHGA